jgi:hypothetical protein
MVWYWKYVEFYGSSKWVSGTSNTCERSSKGILLHPFTCELLSFCCVHRNLSVLRLLPSIQRNDAPLYLYYCNETKCDVLKMVLERKTICGKQRVRCAPRARTIIVQCNAMDGSHSPGIINQSIRSNHEQKPFGSTYSCASWFD